jgi:hypothetical protein
MTGDTAQELFENMAARLTNVFGPDSGPAEDDPDFHMPAHICTGSIDNRHWIEQSTDQKRLHAPAQTGLSGENLPNNRTCTVWNAAIIAGRHRGRGRFYKKRAAGIPGGPLVQALAARAMLLPR